MKHSVEELTHKITVMYEKCIELHRIYYSSPENNPDMIDVVYRIEDIQALAREIANDLDTNDV
jgi:hypothetical protein